MITVYLAIWFSAASAEVAPIVLAPVPSREACLVQAEKLNNTDEQLNSPQGKSLGAEAVCLIVTKVVV